MGVILIAFERESEQSALETLLSGRGHRVLKSANGLAALDTARREPPQAIVSDIVLPRMDGFALCRKWKQDERLQSIPFVFYTRRHDDPKYERFALELGAERFLARSTPPEKLLSALDELLPPGATANAHANGHGNGASGSTRPMNMLDTAAMQRFAMLEKSQADAVEKAQFAQKQQAAQAEALEKAQRQQAAQTEALDKAQKLQAAQTEALERAQRAQAEAVERAERIQAEAEQKVQQAQAQADAQADAVQRATQAHSQLRSQVSELEASSKRLAEGEARFRRVFESNPLPMWIADHATGGFIAVNDAALALYGYGRAEFLGLKTAALVTPGGDAGTGSISMHQRKDGDAIAVSIATRPIEFDGRDAELVSAFDLTQRLEIERQLSERANSGREQIEAAQASQRRSEFLVDLFKQADSFDESAIVRRAIDQAMEVARSPLGFLYFVDAAQKTITLAAWRDGSRSQVVMANSEPHPIGNATLFIDCVRGKYPTSSNDLARKSQNDGLPELTRYVAVPMLSGDEVVAVLGVGNRDGSYTEEDQRALALLADGVWRVLQSKRARVVTLSALQRTDVALQGMIDSFVRMSERHDPYTAGSSRRLAALAVAIGREAGLDGERQHGLRVAALLHDIGNIAVPASILSKPAPLTDSELALVRTHVEEGCQLLADIDLGAPVADIIYQSHERCDGSGYPRGLRAEEIMLEARILAIADTIEAMCSPRPHRPAAGMDAALDEINRGAGKRYDEYLVAACTRLIRQHGFKLPD